MHKNTRTTTPKKSVPTTNWITRINAALKLRAENEAEIAAALREHLDTVGEKRWLEDCEREWGWSRTTCYRHLNPKLMEAARAHTCAVRSNVGTSGPRPLDEIADDLRGLGLKQTTAPEPPTITCTFCSETYPKRNFTKHVETCPGAGEAEKIRRLKGEAESKAFDESRTLYAADRGCDALAGEAEKIRRERLAEKERKEQAQQLDDRREEATAAKEARCMALALRMVEAGYTALLDEGENQDDLETVRDILLSLLENAECDSTWEGFTGDSPWTSRPPRSR